MKKTIDNPKVFISYAWGSKEYQNKVLSFASKLMGDGISVIIDKWDLSEGNDTYAFMEKSVLDESITNVLILLDPIYAKKANEHIGGVGTETQIISAKVYKEVNQDKFIPVVMERDDNGDICKPVYLEGRLHFDLSKPDDFDYEYQRVVRFLFGVETFVKPELGQKPKWVDHPEFIELKKNTNYDILRDPRVNHKDELFINHLNDINSTITNFINDNLDNFEAETDYINFYDSSEHIRNEFLQLISYSAYIDNPKEKIASFFEKAINAIRKDNSYAGEVIRIRIHEMFIYLIAYFWKVENYEAIGYLLKKTYFCRNSLLATNSQFNNYHSFYSGSFQSNLDSAVKKKDQKNYYTGTGQYWINTLSNNFCTKEQFVLADLILFNYSYFGNNSVDNNWQWFPITYVYDNEFDSALSMIGRMLISKEFVGKATLMFGFNNADEFISNYKKASIIAREKQQTIRYGSCFEHAHILCDFIEENKIASIN